MPNLFSILYQTSKSIFLHHNAASSLLSQLSPTSSILSRKMSTITFSHPTYKVPITLPSGLSQEQLLAFHPFSSWLSTLQASLSAQHTDPTHPFHAAPYTLNSITVQSYDLFRHPVPRLGFVKLTASITNRNRESLPGAVFLRGPSVAVLVILVPEDVGSVKDEEKERWVILTVQPRPASGSLGFVELPAGMVDDETGDFAGAAAREMEEELEMKIRKGDLVCLSELAGDVQPEGATDQSGVPLPHGMYPSPGACDEYIRIYMHERRVPRAQLAEWEGKLTGLREHGEKITLKLIKMKDLWRQAARDAKALSALALWEGLKREGKI